MEYIIMKESSNNVSTSNVNNNVNNNIDNNVNSNVIDSIKSIASSSLGSRKGILEMINDYDQDDDNHSLSINDDDYTNIDDYNDVNVDNDDDHDIYVDDDDDDDDDYVEEDGEEDDYDNNNEDNTENDDVNDNNDNNDNTENIDNDEEDNDDNNNDDDDIYNITIDDIYIDNDDSNNENEASFVSCTETTLLGDDVGNTNDNDNNDNNNNNNTDTINNSSIDDNFTDYSSTDDDITDLNHELHINSRDDDPFIEYNTSVNRKGHSNTTIESIITKNIDDNDSDDGSGYAFSMFKSPPHESMLCPICLKVLRDPVNCAQGHSFCRHCITELVKTQPCCPMDRHPIEVERLAGNLALKNIILSLDVICHEVSNDGKCNWTGALNSLHSHHISCQHKTIYCNSLGCHHAEARSNMFLHKRSCENRLITCNHCKKIGQYKNGKLHIAFCRDLKFLCENGCGKRVSRNEREHHLDNDCSLSNVTCPYFCYGCECDGFMQRKDLTLHLVDARNLKQIIPGLLKRVEADTAKIKKLEDKFKETKSSYLPLLLKVPYGGNMRNMLTLTKVNDDIIITDLPRYLLPRPHSSIEYVATFVTEEWSTFEESGAMINDTLIRIENTNNGIVINVSSETSIDDVNEALDYSGTKSITLLMTIKRKLLVQ